MLVSTELLTIPIQTVPFLTNTQLFVFSIDFFQIFFDEISVEDCERNDGSEERPYFMSKRLMRMLANQNVPGTYHQFVNKADDDTNVHYSQY